MEIVPSTHAFLPDFPHIYMLRNSNKSLFIGSLLHNLVFDLLLVIDSLGFNANLVLILSFSYQSFP